MTGSGSGPRPALRRVASRAVSWAAVVLLSAALGEVFLYTLRHSPALARIPGLSRIAEEIYVRDRTIVTLLPQCARYDPVVTYTLRPGTCTFANTEYRTAVRVNRLGVRGDESDLRAPELLVTGDSFAMGWGVEGQETFAAVLGRLAGKRVLNASVPSYGTVRELMLLTRADLSLANVLVIQFCNNDYDENRTFAESGDKLPVTSEQDWLGWVAKHEIDRRYWPGRYLWMTVDSRRRRLFSAPRPEERAPDPDDPEVRRKQVAFFLNALAKSPVDLSGTRVVVFEGNSRNRNASWFIPMLREALARGASAGRTREVVPVDVAARLTPDDFFVIDDHLNAAGHRHVAQILLPFVETPAPKILRR